jgi:hypothetical protein
VKGISEPPHWDLKRIRWGRDRRGSNAHPD